MILATAAAAAQSIPPDSLFGLCGAWLGMPDSAVLELVDSTAWDYSNLSSSEDILNRDDAYAYLVAADTVPAGDRGCLAGPGTKQSQCLHFDVLDIKRCHRKAIYITWEVRRIATNDMSRLRMFAAAVLDPLQRTFGKPMAGAIPVASISAARLARVRDKEYGYSTIAKWEWYTGGSGKGIPQRYVWVATQRVKGGYRFMVVMSDATGPQCD